MGFTALDIIVIVLVGGGLVFGWLRGFVAEVLSLFAWFLAILALRLLHAPLAGALERPVGTASGAAVLAFILIFGVVFVGGKMASRRLGSRVRNSIVGPLDRVLGAAFGALKGLIGATILFMVLNLGYGFISRERPEWMTRSATYNLLKTSSGHMADLYETQRNGLDEAEANESRTDLSRKMTQLRLHDTMAREKRVFTPADPERVTMYVCGPTVYNRAHIGNARAAVVFDLLSRLLRHLYGDDKVIYARNVTDVDDKIIAAAEAEGVAPETVTRRYEDFYLADMGALGVRPPDIAPHATRNIEAMTALIARLIETGNAYEADGHVLFHVPSDPDYGALGRRDRDAMIAGARVEVASYKKDPADFVLWKPSDAGVIGWDSPWGRGRPGWHIECSAMIADHLGETIDIHGGGLDLIFPHHENEIAQSRCAHNGAPLAHYWVHNGFLSMAGAEKMSKSLGNVVTVGELLEQDSRGEIYRFALLSAHYRQPLEWSDSLIGQSKATLDRLYRTAGDAEGGTPDPAVLDALADDLNTPLALSRLSAVADGATLRASAALMGLLEGGASTWFQGDGDSRIDALVTARAEAKKARDFAEADRIRADLDAEGVVLEDGPQGTTWRRA